MKYEGCETSKQHSMAMSFIYMNWIYLEEHKLNPEEIANYMEWSWKNTYEILNRKRLIAAMERGHTIRAKEPPDFWIAAIRIIRSRTEYF